MSYAKAMKHARNVRKCRKQSKMYMGFDTGGGRWPSIGSSPALSLEREVKEWFRDRHIDAKILNKSPQYVRECIRESITKLREIRRT